MLRQIIWHWQLMPMGCNHLSAQYSTFNVRHCSDTHPPLNYICLDDKKHISHANSTCRVGEGMSQPDSLFYKELMIVTV